MDGSEAVMARIAELVPGGGRALDIAPCAVSGNNRVFRVTAADGASYIAKSYYHHPSDTRDRLHAEWSFLSYAAGLGIACVPRPLSRAAESHLALYEFVAGEKVPPGAVTAADVAAAADFLGALNPADRAARAAALPVASEGCFSIADHLASVDGRIARLGRLAEESAVHAAAIRFADVLAADWTRRRAEMLARAAAAGHDAAVPIATADRGLSPSDFGFHNALRRADGTLAFIDFEYAGWDDPAKTLGDFFSQPAVPVDRAHRGRFLDALLGIVSDARALEFRAALLEPAFALKWCCIMLNEFLPEAAARRRFADPASDTAARQAAQLAKAERAFELIQRLW
ncbi:MAG: aminoglycoside phosphotransferase family protein [Gammaproteobacteria bacterium]|nr:aminoglycoside phosphotransferase family protein [Gammaproteobacteria bacterium]